MLWEESVLDDPLRWQSTKGRAGCQLEELTAILSPVPPRSEKLFQLDLGRCVHLTARPACDAEEMDRGPRQEMYIAQRTHRARSVEEEKKGVETKIMET